MSSACRFRFRFRFPPTNGRLSLTLPACYTRCALDTTYLTYLPFPPFPPRLDVSYQAAAVSKQNE